MLIFRCEINSSIHTTQATIAISGRATYHGTVLRKDEPKLSKVGWEVGQFVEAFLKGTPGTWYDDAQIVAVHGNGQTVDVVFPNKVVSKGLSADGSKGFYEVRAKPKRRWNVSFVCWTFFVPMHAAPLFKHIRGLLTG